MVDALRANDIAAVIVLAGVMGCVIRKGAGVLAPQEEIIKRIAMIEQAGGIAFGVDLDSAGRAARAVPGQIVEPKTRKQIEELLKST